MWPYCIHLNWSYYSYFQIWFSTHLFSSSHMSFLFGFCRSWRWVFLPCILLPGSFVWFNRLNYCSPAEFQSAHLMMHFLSFVPIWLRSVQIWAWAGLLRNFLAWLLEQMRFRHLQGKSPFSWILPSFQGIFESAIGQLLNFLHAICPDFTISLFLWKSKRYQEVASFQFAVRSSSKLRF